MKEETVKTVKTFEVPVDMLSIMLVGACIGAVILLMIQNT